MSSRVRYYAYDEPGEYGCNEQTVKHVKEILCEQTKRCELLASGYSSASMAIDDWIVVNWAYACDKNGEAIK